MGKCKQCRFWVEDTENPVRDFGLCHKNPPIMVPRQSSYATWMGPGWPETLPTDWCGAFAQARAALTPEPTPPKAGENAETDR